VFKSVCIYRCIAGLRFRSVFRGLFLRRRRFLEKIYGRGSVTSSRLSKWVYIYLWQCVHGSSLRLFSQWNREKLPDTSCILGNSALCCNIPRRVFECSRIVCEICTENNINIISFLGLIFTRKNKYCEIGGY